MTLIPVIRNQLPPECFTTRIRKRRCSLTLDGAPPNRLIVDLDRPGAPIGMHERRCDYLFFAEVMNDTGWVAPIELKSGALKATEVEGQLQSGARAAELLVSNKAIIRFVPIVAGTSHKAERKRLALRKVTFRGVVTRIKLRPCNSPLAKAFRS